MRSQGLQIRTPDLGERRGVLSDWITQRWVRVTGRSIDISAHRWLEGPAGDRRVIGSDFFARLAEREGLILIDNDEPRGLLTDFSSLQGPSFRLEGIRPEVAKFYEQTSQFDLDVWSEWHRGFRPFGGALMAIFSRRLEQLNMPLSGIETSEGVRSRVLHLVDSTGAIRHTAWVRSVISTGRTLYAGSYSLASVPGHPSPCVKVVFPLPNGNATVVMKPAVLSDGSFTLESSGEAFGDPGFYFLVESDNGRTSVRYVRAMRELIRVYVDERDELRADHDLRLFGAVFLRLRYRMRRRAG